MSDSAEQNATDPNDDRRRIVRDQLKRWHPFLSVMYDDVLRDLQSLELGGESRLLVMHISHNMREIVNGIGEARGLSLGKQVEPSTSTLIRELASMADVFTFDVTGEARAVPVPRELAEHLQLLMRASVREKRRSDGQVAELFSLQDQPNHPALRSWKSSRAWFVDYVHWERLKEKTVPSKSEIVTRMQDLEDYVVAESNEFFALADEIKDITRAANSEDDA